MLVEGPRAVATALDGGARVRFAVVSPRLDRTPGGPELAARLRAAGIDVRAVDEETLDALADTETPQGVLAVVEEPRPTLGDLDPGRFLVLDAVQDPGNAGTLVRAAAAFGLDAVLALDGTVDLWSPKAVRASAGLGFHVPLVRCGAEELVAWLGPLGVELLVADAAGRDVRALPSRPTFALAVGNEGRGVRDRIRSAAAGTVAVPMRGPAESLNVGIAGSILLHALSGGER